MTNWQLHKIATVKQWCPFHSQQWVQDAALHCRITRKKPYLRWANKRRELTWAQMMDVERLAGGLWMKQKNICERLREREDDGRRSAQEWISNAVAAASSTILTHGWRQQSPHWHPAELLCQKLRATASNRTILWGGCSPGVESIIRLPWQAGSYRMPQAGQAATDVKRGSSWSLKSTLDRFHKSHRF